MQNIDFYNGTNMKNVPPQFSAQDPEYFTRIAKIHYKEQERARRKASRMLSFIIALCIICFTAGLMIGIKFSGADKEIMDKQTMQAMSTLGENVKNMIQKNTVSEGKTTTSTKKLFPKKDFPYVIRVGKELTKMKSQEIANFLSNNGHTVIISKGKKDFNVYTGPYRSADDAQSSVKTIKGYSKSEWFSHARIMQR